jgi:hypothetical protein
VTAPVLALVTAWPAWQAGPGVRAATIAVAIYAAVSALLVHEIGHRLAARRAHAQVAPTQWGPGVALALLLLPAQLSIGPYVGQRVRGAAASRAWWVYLAGPAANLLAAGAAYALFVVEPLPVLRLIAQVQLAAIAYALLPFRPLDGQALVHRWPVVAASVSLGVSVAGVLFSIGVW